MRSYNFAPLIIANNETIELMISLSLNLHLQIQEMISRIPIKIGLQLKKNFSDFLL